MKTKQIFRTLKIFRRLVDRILCYLVVVLIVLGILVENKTLVVSSTMLLILMTYFSIVIEPRMDSIEEFNELIEEIRDEKSKEKGEKWDKKEI